jgi:hypothetical protein
MSETLAGAYGFRLSGLDSEQWLGVTGAEHWPEVSCVRDSAPGAEELRLDVGALVLRVRSDVAHGEFVHPLLGRVASHLALAHGADGIHAGAVAGAAGAWGVLGPKGAGKSTLLASLARVGIPIVTDDVLVFTDGVVTAGPRCIDLRPDAQTHGVAVAVRPSDPRNRVLLPPIVAEHSLAGLIHLEWSATETSTARLDYREALSRLLILRGEQGYPRNPRKLLDLAALPTLRLRRPRSALGLNASVMLMQRVLGDLAVAPARAAA